MIKGFSIAPAPDGNEYLWCNQCGDCITPSEVRLETFVYHALLMCPSCYRRHIVTMEKITIEGV